MELSEPGAFLCWDFSGERQPLPQLGVGSSLAGINVTPSIVIPWLCRPWQDFETNEELKFRVIGFLEEVIHDPELLTQERKAAANIIR